MNATSMSLSMREILPDRRRSWTQEVIIGGVGFCLSVGEYADGRPGEIWIETSKEGTFTRGVLATLSRTVSIALQCGAELDMILHSLRGIDYPPSGPITDIDGSVHDIAQCDSVTDWVASELEARYLESESSIPQGDVPSEKDVYHNYSTQPVEKPAGYISESWRTGA